MKERRGEKVRMRFGMVAKAALAAALTVAATLPPATTATASETPRRIEIVARRFAFVPAEVTLRKGEPVVLIFHTEDVAHGIKFKELDDLQTEIPKGVATELRFTPEKTGDFAGHCSRFCGAGHGSMMMTLHVTE
jgi:cytochrome c oxidase subunit II